MYERSNFFRPNDKFFDFLKAPAWRWRSYHDIGAGTGFVAKSLALKGFEVSAVEMMDYPNSVYQATKIMDVREYLPQVNGGTETVLMLCRPCHHRFLTETVFKRSDIFTVLYVGLERNLIDDGLIVDVDKFHAYDKEVTGSDVWAYKILEKDVGEDGEMIIQVMGKANKVRPFARLKDDRYWRTLGTKAYPTGKEFTLTNANGGYMTVKMDRAEDLEFTYALHHDQLLAEFNPQWPDDHDIGWLAPDGTFYPCTYAGHDTVAHDYLCVTTRILERKGFIRAHGPDRPYGPDSTSVGGRKLWGFAAEFASDFRKKPTIRQRRWLLDHGYDVF